MAIKSQVVAPEEIYLLGGCTLTLSVEKVALAYLSGVVAGNPYFSVEDLGLFYLAAILSKKLEEPFLFYLVALLSKKLEQSYLSVEHFGLFYLVAFLSEKLEQSYLSVEHFGLFYLIAVLSEKIEPSYLSVEQIGLFYLVAILSKEFDKVCLSVELKVVALLGSKLQVEIVEPFLVESDLENWKVHN